MWWSARSSSGKRKTFRITKTHTHTRQSDREVASTIAKATKCRALRSAQTTRTGPPRIGRGSGVRVCRESLPRICRGSAEDLPRALSRATNPPATNRRCSRPNRLNRTWTSTITTRPAPWTTFAIRSSNNCWRSCAPICRATTP